MAKYKCNCKEFEISKTTMTIVDGKVVTREAYCEDCKSYGSYVKQHKGFGGIIKKPNGTVSKKF